MVTPILIRQLRSISRKCGVFRFPCWNLTGIQSRYLTKIIFQVYAFAAMLLFAPGRNQFFTSYGGLSLLQKICAKKIFFANVQFSAFLFVTVNTLGPSNVIPYGRCSRDLIFQPESKWRIRSFGQMVFTSYSETMVICS